MAEMCIADSRDVIEDDEQATLIEQRHIVLETQYSQLQTPQLGVSRKS